MEHVNSQEKANTRLLGLDILKILSTFLIVIHHLSKHGGFFQNATPTNQAVLTIANALFLPSVNIFVFVSAYLINKKGKASWKNYLKLYGQILFYTLLTYTLACLLKFETFSLKVLIKNFLPISYPVFWFAKAYLVMYLISPLLLKITQNMQKKEYLITIIISLIIITICSYFKKISFLPLESGFNAIWFAVLFIFAGYQAKFGVNLKKYITLIIFAISSICACFIILKYKMSVNYTHIIVVVQTISLFNLMYDIKTTNKIISKIITYISTCTFGIYLLHDGKFIQSKLYNNIFQTYNYYSQSNSLAYFLLFLMIIFIAGIIVETIRKLCIKLIKKIISSRKQKTDSSSQ